jgi:hypothetical protein
VREKLDIWPAFPLFISISQYFLNSHMKDVIAAFKHRDRIYTISIFCLSSLPSLLHLMLEPFPALKSLDCEVWGNASDIPDSFLGGSAPHLQHLDLTNMPFPALPTLLLSVTDLVTLTLRNVPPSVYISPEVMITCLSAWTRLERFMLLFQSPRSHPDRESQLSSSKTCAALPVLTSLDFTGRSEYLEELVAWIDETPLLDRLNIEFFDQPTFHTPRLSRLGQFISRAPKFQVLTEASVAIIGPSFYVTVPPPPQAGPEPQAIGSPVITLRILVEQRDWQPSTLTRLCIESLPLFHTVEHFCMVFSPRSRNIKNTEWLELLHPFAAVKNLYLAKSFAPHIIPALDESELFEERASKVLPALKNIFLVDFSLPKPILQAIAQFTYARRRSGNHIDVSYWKGGGSLCDSG